MPGLFGFVDIHTCSLEDHFLEKMMAPLVHFHWYHTDFLPQKGVGVGSVSLSENICIKNKDNILVGYHGDIYDVVDDCDRQLLTRGNIDSIAIIKLYKRYGERLAEKLNGSFNIFIYDGESNTSYLFNDRFGYEHLYLYKDANVFLFSPEIKAFLVYDKFENSLDPHGISDYFVYSYQFSDRTFFNNVKLLPPASVLKIVGDEISVKSYWTPYYSTSRFTNNIKESVVEGYRLFEQSINRCLKENQKILVPLSGGLDSRLIMAVAGKRNLDITTVTFGTSQCLDYRLAKQVCQVLGIPHPQLIDIDSDWLHKHADALIHFGECSYGVLGVATQHAMAQSLGGAYDVLLNGIYGGHVSFGSSYYTREDLTADYSPNERIERIHRGFNGHRFDRFMKNVLTADVQTIIEEYGYETIVQEWERSEQVSDQYVLRQDHIFLYNRIRRGMNNLNQNSFFYNSKQPFASYELFDFYLTLSPELVLDHLLYMEIYKEKYSSLSLIPWQKTGVNLYSQSSKWINYKRTIKNKFSWYITKLSHGRYSYFDHDQYENLDLAYRKNVKLQKWTESILLSDQCLGRGYFSKEGIQNLLKEEIAGKNLFHEISKIVMFELWAREFIDGDGVSVGN